MPPIKHARLSPSASERWISCPASIRMEATVSKEDDRDSPYALEGTAAHAMGEIKARYAFGQITEQEYDHAMMVWRSDFPVQANDEAGFADMWEHTDAYVELLRERVGARPFSQLLLEQRLDTGVPTCWGTSDAVVVSPVHVEIVDLKYGMGVRVEAEGNPQLKLYGVGALDAFDGLLGDVEDVTVTVYQPRLGNTDSATMAAAELREWRDGLLPIAEAALGQNADFGPGEDACRWCPVAGRCRAQVESFAAIDFAGDPELLSPEEIAEQLARSGAVKQWLAALEKQALELAYSAGVDIPGWKVVASGGRRTIPDEEGAILHLIESGHDTEEVAKLKLRTLGELEKLLGKDGFAEELGPYVVKTEGKPSLVVETDRRKAISPNSGARSDFLAYRETEES